MKLGRSLISCCSNPLSQRQYRTLTSRAVRRWWRGLRRNNSRSRICRHRFVLRRRVGLSSANDRSRISRIGAIAKIIALVFHSSLALGILILFIVVSLDDVAHHRAGSGASVLAAFLHQHSDHNLGIAPRSVTDEPGVILKFFLFTQTLARGVADNLRGA